MAAPRCFVQRRVSTFGGTLHGTHAAAGEAADRGQVAGASGFDDAGFAGFVRISEPRGGTPVVNPGAEVGTQEICGAGWLKILIF